MYKVHKKNFFFAHANKIEWGEKKKKSTNKIINSGTFFYEIGLT